MSKPETFQPFEQKAPESVPPIPLRKKRSRPTLSSFVPIKPPTPEERTKIEERKTWNAEYDQRIQTIKGEHIFDDSEVALRFVESFREKEQIEQYLKHPVVLPNELLKELVSGTAGNFRILKEHQIDAIRKYIDYIRTIYPAWNEWIHVSEIKKHLTQQSDLAPVDRPAWIDMLTQPEDHAPTYGDRPSVF